MQDNCKITARLLQDYKSKRANGRWVSQWVSEITGYWAPFGAKKWQAENCRCWSFPVMSTSILGFSSSLNFNPILFRGIKYIWHGQL